MFVTDALLRKSVVVCQSLGRRGIGVTAGSSTRLSPAFLSRYCRARVIYPDPVAEPDDFVQMMLDYLRRHRHDVLFPTDDATLMLISRHREQFEQVTHVPIPTPAQLAYGVDKAATMRLAERLGIPHPATVVPHSPDEARHAVAQLARRSLLVKPRASSGGRGIVYLEPGEDVAAAWSEAHRHYPYPMIQEHVPSGPKYDVCLVMDQRGELVASFAQRELRHFPIQDGLSTMQESVWRPDLVERAAALLREIGWYGLAEVEFMEDPQSGETLLLEINPRFWASVRLAIACGVDFPYLLYQVATRQAVTPVHTYEVGRRCRWLLPGDMLHFLANPNRLRMTPSFFDFRGAQTVYDGFDAADPGASLGTLLACGHYLFDADKWSMLRRGKTRRGAAALPATRTLQTEAPELRRQTA